MRRKCPLYVDFSELSEEEIDELYRPQQTNSRKSLAPLFVYLILQQRSTPEHPLRQQEILKLLQHGPYEINIERKSLSRHVHALTDCGLGIYSDSDIGVWYDPCA